MCLNLSCRWQDARAAFKFRERTLGSEDEKPIWCPECYLTSLNEDPLVSGDVIEVIEVK